MSKITKGGPGAPRLFARKPRNERAISPEESRALSAKTYNTPEERLAALAYTHHFKHLEPDRSDLLASAWRTLKLPPRDYLLDGVFSTTSRWLINGDTGIGKTLFAVEYFFALAAAANFLNWKGVPPPEGVRPARVMYLDGEMPAETFQERINGAAAIYGDAVAFYGYNRDRLAQLGAEMPPLNKPEGQTWLWGEVEKISPDAICFDSMFSLLVGPLSEEDTWKPVAPLIRQLSAYRIGQVWLNHTGHDANRGFGTKTKEWEFDLVAMLKKQEGGDESAILLEITKARLRTPQNAGLFKPLSIRRDAHGWTCEAATIVGPKENTATRKRSWFTEVYRHLADDAEPTPGHNRAPVRKVSLKAIRETMVARGYLETEDGKLPSRERNHFARAKEDLIRSRLFAADATHFWSLK